MGTKLNWVEGPWSGKLALAAGPRGGEWLLEELAGWRREGVNMVLSLLTPDEERELDLANEKSETYALGMTFRSFPIPDHRVPDSQIRVAQLLQELDTDLAAGTNVVVHCLGGIGRTGLVAACLFITKGLQARAAMKHLSAARGTLIPETSEQVRWIDHFASTFTNLK